MKNRFPLTTSQPNVYKASPKRWSERHVKNITSLEKYFSNFHFFYFIVLEKSLTFSDHLTTFRFAPNNSKPSEVVREQNSSDHPLTTAQFTNFANI
jgi:hypothetical protein